MTKIWTSIWLAVIGGIFYLSFAATSHGNSSTTPANPHPHPLSCLAQSRAYWQAVGNYSAGSWRSERLMIAAISHWQFCKGEQKGIRDVLVPAHP